MLDIFRTDAFSLTTLSDAFIKSPYVPGQIGRMGIFRSSGISTTTAVIEYKSGSIELIPTSPRGGVGSQLGSLGKRTMKSFIVPHLEKNATVYADEVQGVRAFGSENGTEAVQTKVNEKLARLRAEHELTLEHMRIGAIQGLVKDSDGSTLIDLFTEFGESQITAALAVDDDADVPNGLRGSIQAAQRQAEAELGAAPVTGWTVICGPTFFDDVQKDVNMTSTLRYENPALLTGTQGVSASERSFVYAGVRFVEYRGGTAYIAAADGFLVPEGADVFRTYYAPADFVETVNTLGLPGYAKIVPDDELNRWVRIHTQSNPLVLCLRPRVVVKLSVTVG
jgi:hypothetical protein